MNFDQWIRNHLILKSGHSQQIERMFWPRDLENSLKRFLPVCRSPFRATVLHVNPIPLPVPVIPSSNMLSTDIWDYIVVGGGLAGSVVSNKLLALNSDAKILVIEAGPDAEDRSDILYANSTNLIEGDFDWNYNSIPQNSLNERKIQSAAGKALGGGSVINTCTIPVLPWFLPSPTLLSLDSD